MSDDARRGESLVVGSELHWLDRDEYREAGRDALAEIAEVHAANRDLRRVDVLTR